MKREIFLLSLPYRFYTEDASDLKSSALDPRHNKEEEVTRRWCRWCTQIMRHLHFIVG